MALHGWLAVVVVWSLRRIVAGAGVLAATAVAGKAITMLRDASVASTFGATRITDCLSLAQVYPAAVCGMVGSVAALVLPPIMQSSLRPTAGRGRLDRGLLLILGGLCALLAVTVSTPLWRDSALSMLAPSWPEADVRLAGTFLTGFFVAGSLLATSQLAGVFLMVHGRFWPWGVAVGLNGALAALFVFLLGPTVGGEALVWGTIADALLGLAIVAVAMTRARDKGVGEASDAAPSLRHAAATIALPAALVLAAVSIVSVIERGLAASGQPGSVAILDWGQRFANLPLSFAILPLAQATYPAMVRSTRGHREDAMPLLDSPQWMGSLWLLSVASAAIAIGITPQFVAAVLGHGVFGLSATERTSELLGLVLLSVPGAALLTLSARSLYAQLRGARVVVAYAGGLCAELLAIVPLSNALGLMGIGLASVVNVYVTCSIAAWSVGWRTMHDRRGRHEVVRAIPVGVAGLMAAMAGAHAPLGSPFLRAGFGMVLGASASVAIGFALRSPLVVRGMHLTATGVRRRVTRS